MTLKIIFNQKILIMLFIIAGSLFPQSLMELMNQMVLYESVRLYEEEKEKEKEKDKYSLEEYSNDKTAFWDNALYTAWKAVDTIVDWATATNWYKLGLSYYEKGQYEEAINSFKKAVELKPNEYLNLQWLGVSYNKNGEYKEAVNSLKKAVELKPNNENKKYLENLLKELNKK